MKLQKTTDIVLQFEKQYDKTTDLQKFLNGISIVVKHANFIIRKLEKQMIVPCDEMGNILEPLKFCCNSSDCGCMGMPVNVNSQKEIDDYYAAEEKVLFSNVEKTIVPGVKDIIYCIGGIPVLVSYDNKNYKIPFGLNIIEDLIPYDVELTETAQKQLGYDYKEESN